MEYADRRGLFDDANSLVLESLLQQWMGPSMTGKEHDFSGESRGNQPFVSIDATRSARAEMDIQQGDITPKGLVGFTLQIHE